MKKLFALVALLILVACVPQRFMAPPASVPVPAVVPVEEPAVPVEEPVAPVESEISGAQTVQAVIENFAYSPAEIKIKVGDTVVWTQKDKVPHTVTTLAGPEAFDSGILPQGETFSYTFTKPGTYEYKCTPHPRMRGKVIVE